MRKITLSGPIALGLIVLLGTFADRALGAGVEAAPSGTTETCRKAEINPVTGHVFCFDPIGAPVAAPPPAAEVPCEASAHSDQAWSWSPKCKPDGAAKPVSGAEG
jgi:hypothetical protein